MTDYDWEMQERKFENDMAAIDLEAENAQLRELAKLAIRSACIGCPCKLVWRLCEGCNIYEMATELGIEVEP